MEDKVIIKQGMHVIKCKNGVGVVHADHDITASQWRGPFEDFLLAVEKKRKRKEAKKDAAA